MTERLLLGTAPETAYHTPVLLKESVDALEVHPGGVYVDATFGGGGHSGEILSRLGGAGHLYAFDQDSAAASNAPPNDSRFTFILSNFRYLGNWMRYYGVRGINGLLADLGVSSYLFDTACRGFSFRRDGPLDMRMNRAGRLTAADIVNTYDEERLADIFYSYGQVRQSRRLARTIVRARALRPIRTTKELLSVCERDLGRENPAKLFQSLRVEVNEEPQSLGDMLNAAEYLLAPGGRLCVITYHSLEDRMVKNFMRHGNKENEESGYSRRRRPFIMMRPSPVRPSEEEIKNNPRSRSAKLRVATRVRTL